MTSNTSFSRVHRSLSELCKLLRGAKKREGGIQNFNVKLGMKTSARVCVQLALGVFSFASNDNIRGYAK